MYLYIYDSFLHNPKFTPLLNSIERRVTDLGIQGKIARLTVLKNIKELVSDAVKAGITTIVAIGDDQTFTKIINVIAQYNITLGLIPIDSTSRMARVLGIPPKELACDVLAARHIKHLDLGKVNNYFFLNSAKVANAKVTIRCDSYTIEPTTVDNEVQICNIGWNNAAPSSDPTDGVLEAIITPMADGWLKKKTLPPTILPFTKIRLTSSEEGTPILIDDQVILKTPADIEVAPRRLKIIVGSARTFLN